MLVSSCLGRGLRALLLVRFCITKMKTICRRYAKIIYLLINFLFNEKKRSEETQTLRAGCSKAEAKISPAADPLPRGAGRPKFNQLEMVTTFTYKPSLVKIGARNFELS